MTELEFLHEEKRALERLNPRMLSAGWTANETPAGVTCCAVGAYAISRSSKGRVEPHQFQELAGKWFGMDAHSGVSQTLMRLSDNYAHESNAPAKQIARWKYVYKWVCGEIKKRERVAA